MVSDCEKRQGKGKFSESFNGIFVFHREQDPLVLSCASNFNEEGALSLWQEQRGEVGSFTRM